jgi:hypothetical protein
MLYYARYLHPLILPSRFAPKGTSLQTPVGCTLGRPDAVVSEILLTTNDPKCTDDWDRLYDIMLSANNVAKDDIEVNYSLSAAKIHESSTVFDWATSNAWTLYRRNGQKQNGPW